MDAAFGGSHRGREATPDVLPASQYLQEKLQERRARNARPRRARQSDFGPLRGRDDDIFLDEAEESKHAANRMFDSSPLAPGSARGSEAGASSRRRALGAKDLDEHMDRLTKQNFALKLELDHRRESNAKLQEQIDAMRAQCERAEQLQDEHSELLRINSQLVEELERRDKAVEEAMDIICGLEDQVTELQERSSTTRPSTAHADSGYAGTETQEQAPPSSPPEAPHPSKIPHAGQRQPPSAASAATSRLLNVVNGQTPARPRREPLVLSQKKPSTHALRSVYLESAQSLHPVKSFNSLLTRQESRADDDEHALNSPRLSVLSESSFPSMYSPKKHISPDRFAWEAEGDEPSPSARSPSSHPRQDSIKRVSQWMDARDEAADTPSKSNNISPPLLQHSGMDLQSSSSKPPGDHAQYQSLAEAMSRNSRPVEDASGDTLPGVSYIKPFPIRTGRQMARSPGPTFGGEPLLPPTPDSASTRMLRASRSSIGTDVNEGRSLLDITPGVVKGYDALEPGVRTAPKQMRSSVELNTAYENYVRRRHDHAYEQDEVDANDDNDDAHSETVRDLSLDYDGFPDGASLLMGTPSRFLKHAKSPEKLSFLNYDRSPTLAARSPLAGRISNAEATVSPGKPSLSRAETSPTVLGPSARVVTGRTPSSAGSMTSPRSYNSGSSSNRTVVQSCNRNQSPELTRVRSNESGDAALASPPRSRASPSPARTLSQKAHGLLRRLSGTGREAFPEREKIPLPTLTSTPSSAYATGAPREIRRPGTSPSGETTPLAPQTAPRRANSRDDKRPSMQARSGTAPNTSTRPVSASYTERPSNLFKRANSATKALSAPPPAVEITSSTPEGNAANRGIWSRRSGIRDAVGSAARRPRKN